MRHQCAEDLVVFVEVCCIASEEEYRLEDRPYLLIPPMLAEDVGRVDLSIQKGEADIARGDCLTYPVKG